MRRPRRVPRKSATPRALSQEAGLPVEGRGRRAQGTLNLVTAGDLVELPARTGMLRMQVESFREHQLPANFLEQYCSYRPDIKMARTSRHVTGSKNRVSENELSNIFQILRKPSPSYHIFFSGRAGQLAPPCTRIPLALLILRALRGTGAGGEPSTWPPPGTS